VRTATWNLYPVWTPDGKHVLYLSDISGRQALWAVPVENGKAAGTGQIVLRDASKIGPVGVYAGSYYFLSSSSDADFQTDFSVSVGPLRRGAAGQTLAATASFPRAMNAAWSPDGKMLAMRRMGQGTRTNPGTAYFNLVVHSLDTGEEKTFSLDGRAGGPDGPIWLHDGTGILVTKFSAASNPFGVQESWVHLDVNTGRETEIAAADQNAFPGYGALSPDDATLYFSRRRVESESVIDDIAALDIATRSIRTVFAIGTMPRGSGTVSNLGDVKRLGLSPDGRVLAFSRETSTGDHIWLVGVDGTRAREIYASPAGVPLELLGWSGDGHSVLVAKRPDILRVAVDDGQAERTGLTVPSVAPPRLPLPSIFLSPDGTRVAMAEQGGDGELWAIDNITALLPAPRR
jgi:Tol biopolymer transport system component